MNESEKIVDEKLDLISRRHGIEILLAVESGSRMWGFESPDSDYDVRFIYKRPLSWYLSVRERRDVIEQPDPIWDLSGWDLKKCLFQMQRGNAAFFEWLKSPTIYRTNLRFVESILDLMPKYFNSRTAIYHYLHMANGNYRQYLKSDMVLMKKYLYVIRPLACCAFIHRNNTMPPMDFDHLMSLDGDAWGVPMLDLEALMKLKRSGSEIKTIPKMANMNEWIEKNLVKFGEIARTTARSDVSPDDLDELMFNMTAH